MSLDDNWTPIGPSVVFNAPPNWPPPPQGWLPPAGWAPPKKWGPAPEGWDLFLELPAGQTAHSGIPGIRTIAPRYADKGYVGEVASKEPRPSRKKRAKGLFLKHAWKTPRRKILTVMGAGFAVVLFFSAVSSPTSERNPSFVARQVCPDAVTTEIAERLEVPEEKVSGPRPTAGPYSPYTPPRAAVRPRNSQTTILNSSNSQGIITAEGNYRAMDRTYWQFSCTIDAALEKPVVTRVVVSPLDPSEEPTYPAGTIG